ncbi:MAG: CoA transferase [Robiginitomaculum sp.]|nr:CoA transferase [Robiginitomaculum sp.]
MEQASHNLGPLAGVLVLDLTRVLAGPWATQMLADMGAEVIKVERPHTGDDTRSWGPPFYTDKDGNPSDASYFMAANRGKKSITINLKTKAGQELVRQLAAKADILIENFKTGHMAKLGLGYDVLRAVNPKIVMCSITGFGQTGPMKDLAGYDYIIQAMSGMMSITGQPDAKPGGGPIRSGVAVSDLFTGFYASSAILAALLHARSSGEGQHIDLALLDCQMASLINQASGWMHSGQVPARTGSDHPNLAPYGVYQASDEPFVLAIGNDAQFARFSEFAGHEVWANDSRFATNADRLANRQGLQKCIEPVIATRPAKCWLEGLGVVGVPAGPIQSVDQAFSMEQAVHRNMTQTQHRDDLSDPVQTPTSPIRFSGTPVVSERAPPALGADTKQILASHLGLSEFEIAKLGKDEII